MRQIEQVERLGTVLGVPEPSPIVPLRFWMRYGAEFEICSVFLVFHSEMITVGFCRAAKARSASGLLGVE